jgi:hypothetical protein
LSVDGFWARRDLAIGPLQSHGHDVFQGIPLCFLSPGLPQLAIQVICRGSIFYATAGHRPDERGFDVHEEAVDAGGPADAQNALAGPWKTVDGFPQAPHRHYQVVWAKTNSIEATFGGSDCTGSSGPVIFTGSVSLTKAR